MNMFGCNNKGIGDLLQKDNGRVYNAGAEGVIREFG
jgi:hypothetical protein